ncbi:MAG: hypothetical protein QOH06_2596 [Acidobacteriota bacterium]|jgi:hypothetical protein|nr:hypothetical protein [Acidobacteriota bacterium]
MDGGARRGKVVTQSLHDMHATPPPPEEGTEEGPAGHTVSREKVKLAIAARAAIVSPGAGSVFGRGLFRRLRGLGKASLVYLALLAIGVAVFLFGLDGNTAGPYKIAMACGAVFFLLVLRALQVDLNRRRERPGRPRQKEAKKEPWTWDYPWSTSWMTPEGDDVDSSLLGTVSFLAVVALCNALWLTGMTFFYIFLTLLDLLALYVLYRLLRKGVQSVRFRTPVVIWEEIPVYPGSPLQGRVAFPRDVRAMGPTRLTLRCVSESRRSRSDAGPYLDAYAVYRETYEVPLPGEPGEPLDVLSFSFKVPQDQPGTALLNNEPVYWHLVVAVPVAGPDLEVAFLAPIYQKRG